MITSYVCKIVISYTRTLNVILWFGYNIIKRNLYCNLALQSVSEAFEDKLICDKLQNYHVTLKVLVSQKISCQLIPPR